MTCATADRRAQAGGPDRRVMGIGSCTTNAIRGCAIAARTGRDLRSKREYDGLDADLVARCEVPRHRLRRRWSRVRPDGRIEARRSCGLWWRRQWRERRDGGLERIDGWWWCGRGWPDGERHRRWQRGDRR